ncbi:hypothetical protein VTP01DRAFT_10100 [Rhizomucor pusillus]|uniref:uncharacterized protein n=1 Tax=Rhizomucor pusillus TaxID=4840 RepID=UPI00374235C6
MSPDFARMSSHSVAPASQSKQNCVCPVSHLPINNENGTFDRKAPDRKILGSGRRLCLPQLRASQPTIE